jgi:uncharacterized membrane protein
MADEDSSSPGKWAAIILGIIMAVPVSAILANQFPPALLTLIVVGFLAWAGVRSGVLDREEEDATTDADADPLATLQDRYAAGEISEETFEHRLDLLLESDQRAEDADRLEATAVDHEAALKRE